MSFGTGHPLAYPICVTIGALATSLAWAPFADPDQVAALAVVALGIIGYTAYRLAVALWIFRIGSMETPRTVDISRVRQQHRLVSRSWLEIHDTAEPRWLPVYFEPVLMTITAGQADFTDRSVRIAGHRVYPSGRLRDTEPPGRLLDNPTRPDPDATALTTTATRIVRRLLLDAQATVAAPFVGLFWVYVAGGGLGAFTGAVCIAAASTIWFAAISGSDPS
ncbi:hypothetical protein [Nocardia vinacea]|uniref:hypothetical protein n=1 Tax=Nocardia vinacea TaxID=96468 RepID=UPI00031AFDC3|nr:hypothetical protein [Nocardia vinacea]